MKRNFRILGWIAIVAVMASCTSSQYGYDDVYDHNYPVAVAKTKTSSPSTPNNYYENQSNYRDYNVYQEEDYNDYNSSYNSGYNQSFYSNRVDRYYRPSFSIGYFSPGFSTFGFGLNNYYSQNNYYNSSPFFGYNQFFNDPYDWHIHHYHHSQLWGNNWGYNNYNPWFGNNYGFNNYNPWNSYGNNFYCPPGFGFTFGNPFYSPFNSPFNNQYYYGNYDGNQNNNNSNNNTYYAPRSNYQSSGISAQPMIQSTFDPSGQPTEVLKSYDNGVKVKTQFKPNYSNPVPTQQPSQINTPKQNNNNQPVVTPRYNNQPSSAPKPKYNNPSPSETPKPRPSYTAPKPTVKPSSGSSPSTPQVNPNSGVKLKTTPR